jgi:coproporphyrinogen III oxidase
MSTLNKRKFSTLQNIAWIDRISLNAKKLNMTLSQLVRVSIDKYCDETVYIQHKKDISELGAIRYEDKYPEKPEDPVNDDEDINI